MPDMILSYGICLSLYLENVDGLKNMETSFFDSINDFHGEGKFGKYKVTHSIVKTNLFGNRSVHAYVTSSSKGARRLFFSTASVPELHMSCAWLENSELRNCPVEEAFFSSEIV